MIPGPHPHPRSSAPVVRSPSGGAGGPSAPCQGLLRPFGGERGVRGVRPCLLPAPPRARGHRWPPHHPGEGQAVARGPRHRLGWPEGLMRVPRREELPLQRVAQDPQGPVPRWDIHVPGIRLDAWGAGRERPSHGVRGPVRVNDTGDGIALGCAWLTGWCVILIGMSLVMWGFWETIIWMWRG